MKSLFRTPAFLSLMLLSVGAHSARAAEVVIYSTNAARGVLEVIAPEFERASGHVVKLKFGTTAGLKGEIEKGAAFDAVLLTDAAVDDLIKQGRLTAASRSIVFKSSVGVAAKKDAAAASVASEADLKVVLLNAKSIAVTAQGLTGPVMKRAFDKLGIAETMNPRVVAVTEITSAEAVAQGKADIAFAQISEIIDTHNVQLLGPLPAGLQSFTTFVVAIATDKATAPVQAFITALSTSTAKSHMRERGLQPE